MELGIVNPVDTRTLIRAYLEENGTKAAHVARKIGISRHYLSNILSLKRNLSEEHLQKINEVLKTNF